MCPKSVHFLPVYGIFLNFCEFLHYHPRFSANLVIWLKIPLAYSYYMPYFDTYLARIYRKISLKIFFFTHPGQPKALYQPRNSPSNPRPQSYRSPTFAPCRPSPISSSYLPKNACFLLFSTVLGCSIIKNTVEKVKTACNILI